MQSEGLLSRLLRPLLRSGLSLMKSLVKPLAKSVLIPLGLTAAVPATDAAIQKKKKKKIHGFGSAALIISWEEMEDIMKIVKSLEESGLLIKGVSKTIKNVAEE